MITWYKMSDIPRFELCIFKYYIYYTAYLGLAYTIFKML